VIAYASRTGTRQNLRAMRLRGWRLFAAPEQLGRYPSDLPVWDDGTPAPYALDNGAWTAFQRGTDFDGSLFRKAVSVLGRRADFVVAPDIVTGGMRSLSLSREWVPWLLERTRKVLIPVQDGMKPGDVVYLVGPRIGLFVGGSTEWKLASTHTWGRLSQSRGTYMHVGRVNSAKRIHLCTAAGADSFDGTSLTRFSCNANLLDNARRQLDLWGSEWTRAS